ncbi:hypothetical protein PL8927_600159 [Planktothrix serta PCC 8927]|uniref:Uncharacterized protein n=1 Tax=Planktothrix serta PCC 8927 TaxID=671068 RepID=A0A7Z9BQX6_9CYAN|nr:hypothetical protein PL8927_600159 [Planktothrix serta PCC 8927]
MAIAKAFTLVELSTNTVGHTGIEACGEDVRLVAACCKKHSSVKQESPVKLTL